MKNEKMISSWLLRIAACLFCLVLVSYWMLGNLYAKYTTETSMGDGARVASFSVGDENTLQETFAVSLVPGETKQVQVKMTNHSEVAVRYLFDFTVEGDLPLQIKPAERMDEFTKNAGGAWVTERPANLTADDAYLFDLSIDGSDYSYAGGVASVELTVTAEQID